MHIPPLHYYLTFETELFFRKLSTYTRPLIDPTFFLEGTTVEAKI